MIFGRIGSESWLAIGLCFAAFGSFSWALRRHFEPAGRLPAQMRILSLISFVSYVNFNSLLLREGAVSSPWTDPGLCVLIGSIGLFWWAVVATKQARFRVAFSVEGPEMVLTRGPYAYVRHPFYVSYIAFWLATAMIAGQWQWLPTAILTLLYVQIAREEEHRFRVSGLANLYAVYRKQTGMMLPRLKPAIPRVIWGHMRYVSARCTLAPLPPAGGLIRRDRI